MRSFLNTKNLFRSALICASLLASLFALQSSSQAYSTIRVNDAGNAGYGIAVRWDMSATRTNQANGRILYKIGANGTADTITGPFDEFAAIQKSFDVWASIDGLDLDFAYDGSVAAPVENGNDDVNTILWDTGNFGPGELAVTTTTFDTTNGQILDADLAFNDDTVWDTYAETATRGSAGRAAIRHTAIHEIGHFLGLDHAFLGRATLFPFTDSGALSGISLEHDDISGLVDAHASTSPLAATHAGSVSGTVTLGGVGQLGVQVTLIDLATGKPLVSSLSNRTTPVTVAGTYKIDNVPPGNYWISASPILPTDIGFFYSSTDTLTDFAPMLHGVASNTTGEPTVIAMAEGETIVNIDFALDTTASLFEANETVATAQPMAIGEGLAAHIESTTDLDHYSFTAAQNEVVTIRVHADGLGSDLNPFLVLYDTDGTTKLASGDFNDSGEAFFLDAARDLESDAFILDVLDFDAAITFTAPSAGDYTILVDGTSFTTGFYFLTVTSEEDQAALDANATTLLPALPSVAANGNIQIAVEPRNITGTTLPTSTTMTVELFDVTGGGMNSIGMTNGPGPWVFTFNAAAAPSTRLLQARVDGAFMDQVLSLDVYGAVNGAASVVQAERSSLPADGNSRTIVRAAVRDAAGMLVSDTSLNVTFTTTAGNMTNSVGTSASVLGDFDASTGLWEATLIAPSSGTLASVSVEASGTALGSVAIALTESASAPASTGGGGTSSGDSGGGGGGCALVRGNANLGWCLLALLFGSVLWTRRRA